MSHLPIIHMTLYKHGVGYFQRRGPISGEEIKLTYRREEMDDLLKSLTVIDHGGGAVRGVDYDTPQTREERLAGCSISLSDSRSLRDLLQSLRGRLVQLLVSDGSNVTGTVLGLDEVDEKPLEQALVSLLQHDTQTVAVAPLNRLEGVELLDEAAAADLRFFLQTEVGQETHRSITIRLSPGDHDLEVSYIAPAPTWRVSYRLVTNTPANEAEAAKGLLQGWGIFDNQLEEDLTDISLSLTAGMPISFMYDLYTPHTPKRPVVKDEERVAAAPIMFEAAVAEAEPPMYRAMADIAPAAPAPFHARRAAGATLAEGMAGTVQSAATGQALGELFQYNVSMPVSVGRGQSAMVPIVSSRLGPKKDLIYNGAKMPTHPVATIRFKNSTGLTLERGPVTVLEDGEYVGEAVLPFTVDQSEAVISYAVELGVKVLEEVKTESQLHGLQVKDGFLLQQLYDLRRLTYRLNNSTAQPKTVLLEHNLNRPYTIFDTPEPVEKTLESHRYKVETLPGKITEFTVQERYLRSHRLKLEDLSYQNLQTYFDGKFLDKTTYAKLKELLDAWALIGQCQRDIQTQEQRRDKIYKAQEQAQKNMAVLSNSGEEGKLRGRYVQQLTQSEADLAEIDQTIARLQGEIEQTQSNIKQMIATLSTN